MLTTARFLQLEKALAPIFATPPGMVTVVIPQPEKDKASIVYKLFGRANEVKLLQSENADSPMDNTLLGKAIEERLLQFLNAYLPIVSKPSDKVTEVRPLQLLKAYDSIC